MLECGIKVTLLESRSPDISVLFIRHDFVERLRGMSPICMIYRIRCDPDDFFPLFLLTIEGAISIDVMG